MGDTTTISWTHATYNPWIGCQKVSPACDNCYAEVWDSRFNGGSHWGPGAPRRRTTIQTRNKPHKWNREALAAGVRTRVFCASLADVFDNAVDPQWRRDLAKTIRETPALDWLLLTKRIGNAAYMIERDFDGELPGNVWLGASVAEQKSADRDVERLLEIPATIHWLSMEPLIERVKIDPEMMNKLDMIVVGGESGANARHMDLDWAYDLLEQARAGQTLFHFKQLSEHDHPRTYDDFDTFPEDLKIREMPLQGL